MNQSRIESDVYITGNLMAESTSLGAVTLGSITVTPYTLDITEIEHLDGQDQGVKTTDSPTFANITDSALSASQAVMTDGSKKLVSADYLNQAVKSTSSPTFAALTIGAGATGITKTTDDLLITCASDKTVVLSETVWDDFPPNPIIAAKLGATAPTLATFVTDIEQYTFDATNDYVIGSTEIPHNWKEGTVIYPHIHWATNGTNASDRGVQWQLKWTVGDAAETFSTQVTSVIDVMIPLATADRTHLISEFGTTLNGANLKIAAVIAWRLDRIATAHANGAPAKDPFALSIGFHGEMDTVGSRGRTTK